MRRPGRKLLILGTGWFMLLAVLTADAQTLSSARAIALGANTAFTGDPHSIDWNPAGLAGILDWNLVLTNDVATTRNQTGVAIQSIGIARQFPGHHGAALSYNPDKVLELVVPSSLTISDQSGTLFTARFDRRITYRQPYSGGYGVYVLPELALGASIHYYQTTVSDARYSLDSNGNVASSVVEAGNRTWTGDCGAMFSFGGGWTAGLTWKNLLIADAGRIDSPLTRFSFHPLRRITAGVGYRDDIGLRVGVEADSRKHLRIGAEWTFLPNLRAGFSLAAANEPATVMSSASAGIGYDFGALSLDLSYIRIRRSPVSSGYVSITDFNAAEYCDIDDMPFGSDRLSFSGSVRLGTSRQPMLRIEYVEMLTEVFPAMSPLYASRPVGRARVKNTGDATLSARIRFAVEGFTDASAETPVSTLQPGEVAEIPFSAVFNAAKVDRLRKLTVTDGTVAVRRTGSDQDDDSYQTHVVIRGRNEWNGDISLLTYFVTPQDPDVIRFSRTAIDKGRNQLDTVPPVRMKLAQAWLLFTEMSRSSYYISDPTESQEYVQYPAETIGSHSGDCDDFSVAYASALMSIGLNVAFVDVVPPEDRRNAHVFVLVDTGIPAAEAAIVSTNPKRYVLRSAGTKPETVWLPVETTVLRRGFQEAWNAGAEEYFMDTQVRGGAAGGWVRVVDIGPGL